MIKPTLHASAAVQHLWPSALSSAYGPFAQSWQLLSVDWWQTSCTPSPPGASRPHIPDWRDPGIWTSSSESWGPWPHWTPWATRTFHSSWRSFHLRGSCLYPAPCRRASWYTFPCAPGRSRSRWCSCMPVFSLRTGFASPAVFNLSNGLCGRRPWRSQQVLWRSNLLISLDLWGNRWTLRTCRFLEDCVRIGTSYLLFFFVDQGQWGWPLGLTS